MTEHFDTIIVGAGQAGPALAGRLTAAGMTVALIERRHVGGTCVNTGCRPTKTMVASAYAAHLARRGADFGVSSGPVSVDMAKVAERARRIILDARHGNEDWLQGMPGLELVRGHAAFLGPGLMAVGERRLSAPRIFLNVGGRPAIPDLPGVKDVAFLTNADLIATDSLPQHLVVIGGSYIGLEFAQMFRRFGSRVSVVEMGPRLIAREDEDVSEEIRSILEADGIEVRTSATCISLAPHEAGVSVGVDCQTGAPSIHGSHVLLATGRRPNTDDLGLDKAGIATDARGYITVDDQLATTCEGVWALGDCNGKGAFTHTAWNDYEIVAANLLDGEARRVSARIPGYALYIDPPLGRVGMTESQARASGRSLLVAKRPMSRVGRAVEKAETLGFMKLVADAETREILGAAILGTSGDEAISGVLDLMNAGASIDTLRWAVPIHPTVAELLPTLALDAKPDGGAS
ncbi:pyruvate/2-oxoglutarate dehydrogenase complex dihydrolipoamide dehydrogenase (E3) component [Novosphingobium sp. PhB55]|uniref:FAD-containing oxidoreductase n=1 Tax=unclassified Novosphingobium TaxID=2644732 RepID=UPI0010655C50|nr:FAD-containing oxidoreductase [Novosphingobium sp. PhB55]TDW64475.1 pyruvate/2-oxoglutarate dehydrogenase complex dihydrolipoamide dehydrogenase (E3) component [Novosphingobium sp. PhB55]